MSSILLEVCVDDAAGLLAAVEGGADRVELCSALSLGGLTPSVGLMQLAARMAVPVYAMIRPRAGDFVFDETEIALMEAEIDAARQAGLAGVVLGASLGDRSLDSASLARLAQHADGMGRTLHRAFDLVPDRAAALETAVDLGFERILTSGGETTAAKGIAAIADLVGQARGRLSIMPGSGVSLTNIGPLLATGVLEVHASCSAPVPTADRGLVELGFAPETVRRTSAPVVRALKAAL
ncbi:copper homeostasis protein CutC [Rhizobium sp. Leaf384]|uniref:copper homeostasis protein CutC n=1 Tax=unclassified Rhizobium TaxID=2613769 RepID=UPI0007161389|nr:MULTISPECIES: copper homeostasis protein CutC [unclassified Rhizobium]KQR78197.1 copper homeostasis protein CutC [Rhizobium sp. Leaf341]KQS81408.1 copper homeostasis protein CutC [Rhizobium sp. Leaf384]KQS87318.1 copper homeostasis protein CutC [Rhizobium sp. Leaf383]